MAKEKLSFDDLIEKLDSWTEAVIVFTSGSFQNDYTENDRSYKISSDAKYFNPHMSGNSLFGDCLDGKDNGVRLDHYMNLKPEEGKHWVVDYCYIIK